MVINGQMFAPLDM